LHRIDKLFYNKRQTMDKIKRSYCFWREKEGSRWWCGMLLWVMLFSWY